MFKQFDFLDFSFEILEEVNKRFVDCFLNTSHYLLAIVFQIFPMDRHKNVKNLHNHTNLRSQQHKQKVYTVTFCWNSIIQLNIMLFTPHSNQ